MLRPRLRTRVHQRPHLEWLENRELLANSPLSFVDHDGDSVTLRLGGPGTAKLMDTDSDGHPEVALAGTDAEESSLTISVRRRYSGNGLVALDAIHGTGLENLRASAVDFVGTGIQLAGQPRHRTDISAHEFGSGTTVSVGSTIGTLVAAAFGDGSVIAPSIGSLKIKGDAQRGINGDFAADITLSGRGVGPGMRVLDNVEIAGTASDVVVSVAGGIGSITVGRLVSSSIFAGYTPSDAAAPIRGGTFAAGSTIRSFEAAGIQGSAQPAFVSSTVAAGRVGSVNLASVTTDNANQSFGVLFGSSVRSVSVADAGFSFNHAHPTPQGVDDFQVFRHVAAPTITGFTSDTGTVGDGITNDTTLEITGTAAPGRIVTIHVDDLSQGTTTADATGAWTLALAAQPDGLHTVAATVEDAAGNSSAASAPRLVTIDTEPPTTPLLDLDQASDSAPLGDRATSESTVTLVGQTSPNMAVTLDGSGRTTISDSATGVFSFAAVPLAAGANSLTVRVRDVAGNESTATVTFTRVSSTAFSPLIAAALANDTAPGGVTNNDGVTYDPRITGTVTAVSPIARFHAGIDDTPAANFLDLTAELALDGSFSLSRSRLEEINAGTLTDGTYTLHMQAEDEDGNWSPVSDLVFTLDTTPPLVPELDLSPGSDTTPLGDHQTSAARVTLLGQAEPGATLVLVENGQTALAAMSGAFRFGDVILGDGENVLTVRTTDIAGNASQFTRTIYRTGEITEPDVVLRWDQAALEAIEMDAAPPPVASRALAMTSLAMYDALSAIEGTPAYAISLTAPQATSATVAMASAAHTVLAYLFPAQRAMLDTELANSLSHVPDDSARADGEALGQSIANALIALRRGDGWDDFIDYVPAAGSGAWQPTAPMFDVTLLPQWADLTPFAMTSSDQFRPIGPPALESLQYSAAFEEVKALGRADSATRTAEQTEIARFWADGPGTVTPPGHWNQIAAQIALEQGNSLSQNARLFAQLNVALADAAIVAWDAKYLYEFWRPITAIQQADTDNNPDTRPDAAWTPLLITPPFPEYVSGHSTFSAAAAAVLDARFGNSVGFTTPSPGLPGVERTFTGFQAAAEEAGQSRIYGGIHFQFANQDGQEAGRALARQVLDLFSDSSDTQPPRVLVETPSPGIVTSTNITVGGRVLDNLSGVAALEAQLDDGDFAPLTVDNQGRFTVPTLLALDGPADGPHLLRFRTTDAVGNVAPLVEYAFTLDTQPPQITLESPADGSDANEGTELFGTADGTGSAITRLSYRLDDGGEMPIGFDVSTGQFSSLLNLSRLETGSHTVTLTARDQAGHETATTVGLNLTTPILFRPTAFTPRDGAVDVGSTFRPQVFFSRPVDAASLTAENFFATGPTGTKLPANIVVAGDGSFAWLFLASPMPGAARITVHVDGSSIHAAADGAMLDADSDGAPGGALEYSFATVSLTPLIGTTLSGKVVDPGTDLRPMTFDDVRAGADQILHSPDDVFLLPIAGVKVFIVGLEDQAVFTDAMGNFHFDAVPAGNVKLAIDGLTATNAPAGFYFPEMVMDVNLEAGRANTVMGTMGTAEEMAANRDRLEVYLSRLQSSILRAVSNTAPTMIGVDATAAPNLTPEEQSLLTLEVQPGSLFDERGNPVASGQVGISTVPPELVREMLPPGLLQHTFDITVQAPGISNFSTPAPMTFPNTFNAAPGTQLNFLSFDHTTGRLVIEGTATVSADGQSVRTDPGTGITHPGWHGLTPQGSSTGPESRAQSCSISTDNGAAADGAAAVATLAGAPQPPDFTTFFSFTGAERDYLFLRNADSGDLFFRYRGCQLPPLTVSLRSSAISGIRGLHVLNQRFVLSPGQSKRIPFSAVFQGQLSRLPNDQLYGLRVQIEVREVRSGGSTAPALPSFSRTFYVYRFVDASDDASEDGILKFPDALSNAGVKRTRVVDYHGDPNAQPVFGVRDGTFFRAAALTPQPGKRPQFEVVFESLTAGDHTDHLLLRPPAPEPRDFYGQDLSLSAVGREPYRVFLNTDGLDRTLRDLWEQASPQQIRIEYVPSDHAEFRLAFKGERTVPLPLDPSRLNADLVRSALEGFQSIGAGNVDVLIGSETLRGAGRPFTLVSITVRFIGSLAGVAQDPITATLEKSVTIHAERPAGMGPSGPKVVFEYWPGGTAHFTLGFKGHHTPRISPDDPQIVQRIRGALEALPSIGRGNIDVHVENGRAPGSETDFRRMSLTFFFRSLLARNTQEPIVLDLMNNATVSARPTVNYGRITPNERALFATADNRAQIITRIVERVSGLFVATPGLIFVNNPEHATVKLEWGTHITQGLLGQNHGDEIQQVVDASIQLALNAPLYNRNQLAFRLSQILSRPRFVRDFIYPDNTLEAASGPFELTEQQFVNALSSTIAHEVAHSFGAHHTAFVKREEIANEIQRIELSGGNPGDTFQLNFSGETYDPIIWWDLTRGFATAAEVLTTLQRGSLFAAGSEISVDGSDGGPFLVHFVRPDLPLGTSNRFGGIDVPEFTHTETGALRVAVSTVQQGSSRYVDEPGGNRNIGGVGGVNGRDDREVSARLDVSGETSFLPHFSQPALLFGTHAQWTTDDFRDYLDTINFEIKYAKIGRREILGGDDPIDDVFFSGPRLGVFWGDTIVGSEPVDFGTAQVDGPGASVAAQRLTLINVGSEDAQVRSMRITQGFDQLFLAQIPVTVLHPGETLDVDVTFDPLRSGPATGVLTIDSDYFTGPIELQGTGEPALVPQIVTGNFAFQASPVGQTFNPFGERVSVVNRGLAPLHISAIRSAAGPGQDEFLAGRQNVVVPPGETFFFDVVFRPTAPGLRRGTIEILSDDPITPLARMHVTGTGLTETNTDNGLVYTPDVGNDFVAVETIDQMFDRFCRGCVATRGLPVLRTKSDAGGNWDLFLPAAETIHIATFDPVSGLIAHDFDVTSAAGQRTYVNIGWFEESQASDSDGDGLPNDVEFTVGTSETTTDTDGDGMDDYEEILAGLNPLDGRPTVTGVVAALQLAGAVNDVTVVPDIEIASRQTAFLAAGNSGLAVADVSRFDRPLLLGQIALPGDCVAVDMDQPRRLAAVAAGAGGVHLIDVSNPTRPVLLRTINVNAHRVALFDGLAYVPVTGGIQAYDIVTTELVESLPLGDTINGLRRDGTLLYATVDSGTQSQLQVVDISGLGMVARGSITLPRRAGNLFVADGVAWVAGLPTSPASAGFMTVNVRSPNTLSLLSDVDRGELFAEAISLNGSALGVFVGRDPAGAGGSGRVGVLNTLDPADTGSLFTQFALPTPAMAVALSSGLAYIADGTAGLQVVNFLPFDQGTTPPTMNVHVLEGDLDPGKVGVQLLEGSTVTVKAEITDDVQVRNVELLVDGIVVRNHVSYPYDLSTELPIIRRSGNDAVLQIRSTDTGGNVQLSDPIVIELVPDDVAPTIDRIDPADGSFEPLSRRQVTIQFSEPIQAVSATAANFELIGPTGPVDPLTLRTRQRGAAIELVYPALPEGDYQVIVHAAMVLDRAENPLGANDLSFAFHVGDLIRPPTIVWVSATGGNWADAANWQDTSTLASRLPGPGDDVRIDIPGEASITLAGTAYVRSIVSEEALTVVTAGFLSATETIRVNNTFTLTGDATNPPRLSGTVIRGTGGQGVIVVGKAVLAGATVRTDIDVRGNGCLWCEDRVLIITGGLALVGRATFAPGTLLFAWGTQEITSGEFILDDARLTGDGGTLTLGNDVLVHGSGSIGRPHSRPDPGLSLINRGTIRAVDGANRNGRFLASNTESLTNYGLIETRVGGLFVSHDRSWTNTASGQIIADHGWIALGTSAEIVPAGLNEGTISGSSSTVELYGRWSNTGSFIAQDSDLVFGGEYTSSDVQNVRRSGGRVWLGGTMDNTGRTLTLNDQTGTYFLNGEIRGGALNLGGPNANLHIAGGLLDGVTINGDVVSQEPFFLYTLLVKNGLTLNGNFEIGVGQSIVFQGDQTVTGGAIIERVHPDFNNAARLIAESGSTVTLAADLSVHATHSLLFSGNFVYLGTITAERDASLSAPEYHPLAPSGSIVNRGTILVNPGAFHVALGNLTNEGTIRVDNARAFTLGRFHNLALIDVTNTPVYFGGQITTADIGDYRNPTGSTTIQTDGWLDNTGNTLVIDGTTGPWTIQGFVFGGTIRILNGTSLQVFGILKDVTVEGDFLGAGLVLGGDVTIRGIVTAGPMSLGDLSSSDPDFRNLPLNIHAGTFNFEQYWIDGNSTSSGDITFGPDVIIRGRYVDATFVKPLLNQGLISAGSPRFPFDTNFAFRFTQAPITNAGTLEARDGGKLSIANLVANRGTIISTAGSTVEIGSDFTQDSTGTVTLDVLVTDPEEAEAQLGHVTVGGAAMLAGTLNVNFSGLTPDAGNAFQVMTYASVTGTFATVHVTGLPRGLVAVPVYGPTSLSISVAPIFQVASFTPSDGAVDVELTFQPLVFFTDLVDPTSLSAASFFATDPHGTILPADIVVASDGTFAKLVFADPMPAASLITVHIDGNQIVAAADGALLDADGDGLPGGILEYAFTTADTASTFRVASFTPRDGAVDVPTIFQPQVFFTGAVDPASLSAANFFATDPDGTPLPADIVVALDGSFATLVFADPMPAASRIRVLVDGNQISGADGTLLDADGDGLPGGALGYSFTTGDLIPLVAATHAKAAGESGDQQASLTVERVWLLVDAALARWADAGLNKGQLDWLRGVEIHISDLGGDLLGLAGGRSIFLDDDAAGHGWFIDPTPDADEEFTMVDGILTANDFGPSSGRIDLLTALVHELGHIAGLDHIDEPCNSVMATILAPGLRRKP